MVRRYLVVLACRVAVHASLAMHAEEARDTMMRLHEAVATRTAEAHGLLAQKSTDGFTVLFNYPRVVEQADECACAVLGSGLLHCFTPSHLQMMTVRKVFSEPRRWLRLE